MIPLMAGVTYFIFKKARLHYAEHIIVNTFKTCGSLILQILTMSILFVSKPQSSQNYLLTFRIYYFHLRLLV